MREGFTGTDMSVNTLFELSIGSVRAIRFGDRGPQGRGALRADPHGGIVERPNAAIRGKPYEPGNSSGRKAYSESEKMRSRGPWGTDSREMAR